MDRCVGGGIVAAIHFLSEHGGAVEADLQRFYGTHIGDFPWPLTVRRLRVLVDHLPEESATRRALLPDGARSWSTTHELLACVVDATREQHRLTRMALGVKREPEPFRLPRPGEAAAQAKAREKARPNVDRLLRANGIEPRRASA